MIRMDRIMSFSCHFPEVHTNVHHLLFILIHILPRSTPSQRILDTAALLMETPKTTTMTYDIMVTMTYDIMVVPLIITLPMTEELTGGNRRYCQE